MKKLVSSLIVFILLFGCVLPVFGEEESKWPEIKSESAIVIDNNTGMTLYSKEADKKMYPASTTKIMTALLVLENGNLNDAVTISETAVNSIGKDSSNAGLKAGETQTVQDLLYALMIPSANEAAFALGEYIDGTVEEFVARMNKRAEELGCKNTHFANPSGLHDDEHYTTAYDLSLIAREAMKNETFQKIVSTSSFTLPDNGYKRQSKFYTTNFLISQFIDTRYYYKNAIGIKTGSTSQAGNCLVSAAQSKGNTLIAVTLNAPKENNLVYSFVDSKNLYTYAFEHYKVKAYVENGQILGETTVKNAKDYAVSLLLADQKQEAFLPADFEEKDIEIKLNLQEKIKAPIQKDQVLGTADIFYQGQKLSTVNVIADKEIQYSFLVSVLSFFKTAIDKINIFHIPVPLFIPILFVIIVIICLIIAGIRRRRKRRYRYFSNRRRYR